MSLEFLSGLLLVLTVLGTLAYMAREILTDLRPRKLPSNPSASAATQQRGSDAKPVNEHLIGMIGEVVSNSDDDERPMKARLGSELWPARTDSPDETSFPVGTQIEVTAVRGPIVVVRLSRV
ncbi:MAG TPA: NfeD family protein [Gammaproteobacteria bacterium]|nr:NfeD family protein [Gammaproteobacteria bacterium]